RGELVERLFDSLAWHVRAVGARVEVTALASDAALRRHRDVRLERPVLRRTFDAERTRAFSIERDERRRIIDPHPRPPALHAMPHDSVSESVSVPVPVFARAAATATKIAPAATCATKSVSMTLPMLEQFAP